MSNLLVELYDDSGLVLASLGDVVVQRALLHT
jgi:hypothetical protein